MSLVGFKASNHPQQTAKRGATERDNLGTDPELFAKLDSRFGFNLDVCATPQNAKCDVFFTLEDDGLAQPWVGRIWCNPPYSQIGAWVQKAWAEWERRGSFPAPITADVIVMLLPANRPEQKWWQDMVEPYRDRWGSPLRTEFLRGRPRFVLPGAEEIGPNERPPFGCVLLVWGGGTDGG